MKRFLVSLIAFISSFSSAATWQPIKSNTWTKIYYSKPTEDFSPYRGIQLTESTAGTVAIEAVAFYITNQKVALLNCTKYVYTGELQDTFTFQFSEGGTYGATKDDIEKIYLDGIDAGKNDEEKITLGLTSCNALPKDPMTIFVPSRFGDLSLSSGFGDVKVKLVRLEGDGIRPEFTP